MWELLKNHFLKNQWWNTIIIWFESLLWFADPSFHKWNPKDFMGSMPCVSKFLQRLQCRRLKYTVFFRSSNGFVISFCMYYTCEMHTCEPSDGSIILPILRVPFVSPVNFQNLPPVKKIKYKKILPYILRSIFLEIPHLEFPCWRKTPKDTNELGIRKCVCGIRLDD